MATPVIMPALGMAQETGTLLHWLKKDGEPVQKGEPLMEIETDKAAVELEAEASGTLAGVSAREGDVIPVGQTIAWILAAGEALPAPAMTAKALASPTPAAPAPVTAGVSVSPVARKMAAEHGLDVSAVPPTDGRVGKTEVLAYLASRPAEPDAGTNTIGRTLASPKARRLAVERGLDLAALTGSGPGGAVLAADVLVSPLPQPAASGLASAPVTGVSTLWRRMAENVTAAWISVPHFYLVREVAAAELMALRTRVTPAVEKRSQVRPTFSDLLVRLVAAALRDHPRLNATWEAGGPREQTNINVGLATAVDDGLLVPVIFRADTLGLGEIAQRRQDLVARAGQRRLRPEDLSGGTFTISNLGMYGVDAFNPIVNAPQAAILAVGRIAERVVPVNGQPAVRPMLILTLACDHRIVDGARGARFLDDLATLIEEPWGILA